MHKRIAVLGSGNGSNCQAIIDAVEAGTLEAEIACVITDVKQARILERAAKHSIPAFHVDCAPYRSSLSGAAEAAILNHLERHRVDLVALAGFMRLLKEGLLNAYAGRIVNIHPSLLPDFRGLDAIRRAFEAGVNETGCTVHYVDAAMDTGEIIMRRAVSVTDGDTLESLVAKIHAAEHITYPKALRLVLHRPRTSEAQCAERGGAWESR